MTRCRNQSFDTKVQWRSAWLWWNLETGWNTFVWRSDCQCESTQDPKYMGLLFREFPMDLSADVMGTISSTMRKEKTSERGSTWIMTKPHEV